MLTKEQQEQARNTVLHFTDNEIVGLIPAQAIIEFDRAKEVLLKVADNQAIATAEQLRPIWLKEGEEAALAAVVKWGNESCEEHAESRARRVYLKRKVIRAECPQCRAFLEQEAREEKGK